MEHNHVSMQVNGGIILPDKASLYLTAIEDAEYKEDKIECENTSIIFILFLCLIRIHWSITLNV